MPKPDGPQFDKLYHGTIVPLQPGEEVLPNNPPVHPHMSEPGFVYATPNESNAWHYAELAYFSTPKRFPRVFEVTPTGGVEADPTTDNKGRSRGNFEGDVRSTSPFVVVREVPMPEDMGSPEDWS